MSLKLSSSGIEFPSGVLQSDGTLDEIENTATFQKIVTAVAAKLNAGTFSSDDITDGSTYKRVATAVAAALNAGTYDAAKCTAFGIGTYDSPRITTDCENYINGGIYNVSYDATHQPWSGAENCMMLVVAYNNINVKQVFFKITTGDIQIRSLVAGVWDAAYTVAWTSISDGNGGQPPQKKAYTASVSSATGAATAIYTMIPNDKIYLVFAYLHGTNSPSAYNACAIISVAGTGYSRILHQINGTHIFITVSGNDIQVRQESGATQTVYAKLQEFANA